MKPHVHSDHCREVFALLSDYLDLELPPGACQEIEVHIADCEACVAFTDSLRKSIQLCRQFKPALPPSPLREEAKSQLHEAYCRMLAARRNSETS